MARSLNKAELIGNLTRDPELRYTPSGTAVCSFGIATNRSWTTDTGEKHEETEFHRIVAWNKLAELCSQFLVKGRKVYVQGRLTTRSWTGQDGAQKSTTEIVIEDMILLDSNRPAGSGAGVGQVAEAKAERSEVRSEVPDAKEDPKSVAKQKKEKQVKPEGVEAKEEVSGGDVNPDDIPF
jgi:single-strand DNA-binding protein